MHYKRANLIIAMVLVFIRGSAMGYVLVIGLVVGLFMPMVRSVISFVMWLVILPVTSSHQSDQMSPGLKSQKSQFVPKF